MAILFCFLTIGNQVVAQKSSENSASLIMGKPTVKLTEVQWNGVGCYKIEMPMGTVYFEKDKGVSGFKSFIDPEGKDWIASYMAPGPHGDYRGFPNSVDNFGHPGRDSGSITKIIDGKTEGDQVVLESTNGKFTFQYWFFVDNNYNSNKIKIRFKYH